MKESAEFDFKVSLGISESLLGSKMTLPSLLLKEKVIDLAQLRHHPEKILKGFVRVVTHKNGIKTGGFFLDIEAFEELLESLEYSSKEFWDEMGKSLKSGRVSSQKIEGRLGLR